LGGNPRCRHHKARTFYSALFGWDTDDIDASTKRLHQLGAHSEDSEDSEDIRTVPGVGRIAHCHDDQGTPFSLYEPEPQN